MSTVDEVKVVSCLTCGGPVLADLGKCQTCRSPLQGKEPPYVALRGQSRDLTPLLKWWLISCGLIWIFSGLQLGTTSSLLIAAVTIFFLLRALRAWFAD